MITEIPTSTITIMLICTGISFLNSTINRVLISRFVGWEQYKNMQKEIKEYQTQTRQALLKKDVKSLEKLKKKEPQILHMQKKMAKPQMAMMAINFSYIFIWLFVLYPTFPYNITVAYIPIIGQANMFMWYLICSFFSGTFANRLLGIMPIE